MKQQTVSLMDILVPPGNEWLMELSRRRTDLPPGVYIVRFGDGADDAADDEEPAATRERRRKAVAA